VSAKHRRSEDQKIRGKKVMMAIPGGEERTAGEYGKLLVDAGFAMTRVVPTASDVSIVEAEPT
jgi:hypothetical protein